MTPSFRSAVLLAALLAARAAAGGEPPWLPFDPGSARCIAGVNGEVANAAVRFAATSAEGKLRAVELDDRFTGRSQALTGELFAIVTRDGRRLDASGFRLDGALACAPVAAWPDAARAAERRPGVALTATLADPASDLVAGWRVVLRDGTNYVRQELTLLSPAGIDLKEIRQLDFELGGATVAGTTSGSPVVAGESFLGFEHPMAEGKVVDGRAGFRLRRALPLAPRVPVELSAVLGVAPEGQLRRGFQAYLEEERAAPFRTFLHYNSWYDIGYFTPYTEADALGVVELWGKKLVTGRGVKMDSFLFDDGWDDTAKLWQFSAAFPNGFAPLREATEKLGAGPGIWLSPWGGYGPPRQARLAAAKAAGYEVDEEGLALSGPRYYALFHGVALELLLRDGVNQFKLDGTGSPDKVTPGSAFDSDFAAAIALVGDLRALKPALFVNLTTGTWPSPFWLRTADSIWRGGDDHAFSGAGSDRQRWITYRDADLYGGIVRPGPLFPLNSVMLHGIIYARHAEGLDDDPQGDFRAEVRSYFATGTGLQEMYVSGELLSEANWDDLAAAAKWARARADVLRDSHWIGGDPARGEVYGQASWAPGRGIVALRNPADRPQRFALDVGAALELPAGEAARWTATSPYETAAGPTLRAGEPAEIALAPFEVLVWDLAPAAD